MAINNHGHVIVSCGNTAIFADLTKPIYAGASINSLNGQTPARAVAINNVLPVGHVIGTSGSDCFFWDGGVMYPIRDPNGGTCEAVDLNDSDQVVVNFTLGEVTRAYLWQLNASKKGTYLGLGTLGGPNSRAVAINNQGVIIGNSCTNTTYQEGGMEVTVQHAFLWRNGTIYDLGAHSPPNYDYVFNPDFFFSEAIAINDNGVVTGNSYSINSHRRGFTLTPTFP